MIGRVPGPAGLAADRQDRLDEGEQDGTGEAQLIAKKGAFSCGDTLTGDCRANGRTRHLGSYSGGRS